MIDYKQIKADVEWLRINGFKLYLDPAKCGKGSEKTKNEPLSESDKRIMAELKSKECPDSMLRFFKDNGGPHKAWSVVTTPAWLIWLSERMSIASSSELVKIKNMIADRAKRKEYARLTLHQCAFRSATFIASRSLIISPSAENAAYKAETIAQCHIIRGIINNPFE